MVWRGLQTEGLWLKLLPFLVLLSFSNSEARYALSHTLEQLFPAPVCLEHCQAQTTAPKAALPQQAVATQSGSSAALSGRAALPARARTREVRLEPVSLKLPRVAANPVFARGPPRAVSIS